MRFSPTGPTMLASQIIAHLSIIPMIMYASYWQWLISIAVYVVFGCLGITMTYHRLLSHRSWTCPKWVEYLLVLIATPAMSGSAITWVATHRKHHRYTDTENDPHSPKFCGGFFGVWLVMFKNVEVKYAIDLVRNKFYLWQNKYYSLVLLAYGLTLALISPFLVVYAFLVPAAMQWTGSAMINAFSHFSGQPNNNLLLAFLVWGEGYHKNHHDDPTNYAFGKYDLGRIGIKLLNDSSKRT